MQQLVIGRLKHIIYSTHPDSHVRETAAVLQIFELQPDVHPQAHVPVIEPTNRHALIPLQYIYCVVNTQHDCIRLKCPADGIEYRKQERETTTVKTTVVRHIEPATYLINLNSIHNHNPILAILPPHL
ncbi:hypothetical protein SISSUDRAFT_964950, partial [Sistotremastrum suecicum HHB10207 ss-3]